MLKKILAMLLAFVMMLSLTACGGNEPTEPDDDGNRQERVTEEPKETEEPEEPEEPEEVSADFKAAMDKYEAFIDEYVTFIKKYEEEGRPLSMLSEYTELMTQYTEFAETMAAYNGDNLSAADYAYYLEVMNRVNQKLLELN